MKALSIVLLVCSVAYCLWVAIDPQSASAQVAAVAVGALAVDLAYTLKKVWPFL